jgi:hypothetical protein
LGAADTLLAERATRRQEEAEAATKGALSSTEALISYLKLETAKPRRQLYDSRSKRKVQLGA